MREQVPADLLPHGPAAILIDRVVRRDALSISCEGTLKSDSPLAGPASTPSWVGLEMCAQAAGLHVALGSHARARPDVGFLVEAKDVELPVPELDVGVVHYVEAVRLAAGLGVAEYKVSLTCKGRLVLAGRIKTWMPT